MEDPITIKEEPLEIEDNLVKSEPPEFLLEPKVEVKTEDENLTAAEELVADEDDEALSCPKCGIRYYSARSIKNHIQVCKKGLDNDLNANTGSGIGSVRVVIKGVKLLAEDERRSIRILEQSCFVNDIQKEQEDSENSEVSISHHCGECEVTFKGPSHYARHLYAHTFIKVEDQDMPCICISCGQDFPDKYQLDKHLPQSNCSGQSKFLFPCNLCSKIFTRKDNLRDDLRSHINAERRRMKREYKCKKCSKEYGGQTILNIHQLSHNRKRPAVVEKSTPSHNISKKKKKIRVEIKQEDEPFTEIKIKMEPLE